MTHPDMHPISYTYLPVTSMWVVTLHNLFLYSDPQLPCHPPFYGLRLYSSLAQAIFEPNLLPYKYSNIFKPSHPSYLSAYEDGTDGVPKRWHIKFRCRGITQKKTYNIQNMMKV
jgi:hypothetical protein